MKAGTPPQMEIWAVTAMKPIEAREKQAKAGFSSNCPVEFEESSKQLPYDFLSLQKEFQPLWSQVPGLQFVKEKTGALRRDKTHRFQPHYPMKDLMLSSALLASVSIPNPERNLTL